ncbi:MAG TPA: hypothetical protein VIL88_17765 [Devosia sp.]|jgi:hypothetical protein|uniref:hypothetical protein n=1 Tax=Devosia sp. TaxID=1871048 RepID=UPI002F91F377
MTEFTEIDPYHYVLARAEMRYVHIPELLALLAQNAHVVEGVANGPSGRGRS